MFTYVKKTLFYSVNIILISWLIIFSVGYFRQFKQKYPTTRLKLSGQVDYIAPLEVQSSLADVLQNNLWMINVNKVKNRLYSNPWVQFVYVSKHWPDILQVEVVQHSIIARWNDKFFLTHSGKVLQQTKRIDVTKNINLPVFYGKIGQEHWLIETYSMLLENLAPLGLSISKIEVMADKGIQATLNNNIVLKLGTIDLPDRIERFTVAYKKKLHPIISDISYIDLRYTNGVAVGWTEKGGN